VKQNAPSFSTANVLRGWVEQLPDVPRWRHQTFTIPGYSTKSPITLYWRDGLEVIKHLFSNPVFANCMEFDAYRLVERETNLQVFGEFMSAKYAWDYLVCLTNICRMNPAQANLTSAHRIAYPRAIPCSV
jgi:hypothetical protein